MENRSKKNPISESRPIQIPIPKWKHIVLIMIIGFVVYSNSLKDPFIYDDNSNIVKNVFIKDWGNLSELFSSRYFSLAQEKTYRPITTLSYFIDYSLWELNVIGWHVTNIVLHLINALLVYYLLLLILSDYNVSFITALLFCLHPIQTEENIGDVA